MEKKRLGETPTSHMSNVKGGYFESPHTGRYILNESLVDEETGNPYKRIDSLQDELQMEDYNKCSPTIMVKRGGLGTEQIFDGSKFETQEDSDPEWEEMDLDLLRKLYMREREEKMKYL